MEVMIAKRTRLQCQLLAQGCSGSSMNQSRKRNREMGFSPEQELHEVIDADAYWNKKKASKTATQNGSKVRVKKSKKHDEEEGCSGSSMDQSRKQNREMGFSPKQELHEVIDIDDYWNKNKASKTPNPNGSKVTLKKSNKLHEEEESDEVKEIYNIESPKMATKNNDYGSANFFKTGTHTYFVYSSDDSGSDDSLDISEEEEEVDDEYFQIFRESHHESQSNMNTDLYQSTEDESSSCSESESDNEDDWEVSILNKTPNQPTNQKQSPVNHSVQKTVTKKVDKNPMNGLSESNMNTGLYQSTEDEPSSCSESESDNEDDLEVSILNKSPNQPTNQRQSPVNHAVQKTITKKVDKNPMNGLSDHIDTRGKTNAKDKVSDRYTIVGKANQESKSRRVSREDDGGCVDDLLDSIIGNGGVHGKEGDDCVSLRFRFDDSEDESWSRRTDDSDVEGLFREMNFELECEEIGSYKTPKVEDRDNDNDNDNENDNNDEDTLERCQRGEHDDIYVEEQTGLRCGLCGAVVLESRYVMPKLANYAPDKSKRSYLFDEQQFSSSENLYFEAPDWDHVGICKQTKGTFWELIPTRIQAHLYPHQQEGLEFLWENLVGTIELSKLQKLGSCRGGGCIISHAPGTGKTLLTIVFIESFLKKFPKCCPVIVAPASMLLTWEAEFKKWEAGVSFLNLNSSELLRDEMVNRKSKRSKYLIRAMKISSWSKGGSVLGVSYNLYGKLAGEKMGNLLLDMPRLVVLDEGHTPRNHTSNIWNTLLKLKTKNRVILSGTPFQNNFRELFNTLRLVRPATAIGIANEKIFADMIQPKNMKKSRCRASSEDIKKLKAIISPFVHVHKGHILQSQLPGLKQSVILLNPPPLQKRFIEKLGDLAKTFEYEHKVALASVHPSLLLHCSLSKKEEKSMNKQQLEDMRLHPDVGVKTRFVMELIRLSIPLDEKVLIFSQYIHPLKLLKDQIALAFAWDVGREIMVIRGNTQQKVRQRIINDFNDPRSEVKVLLASTKCCSEGIHLIGASRVVLLDVVWNPSVERQAISRAYRLGQKKVVYAYHLMASGTTEEEKYDRQVEKGRVAELVFSSCAMAGEEAKNKKTAANANAMEVNDKILQQMVDHQELKDLFKKIRYPEKQT